MGRGDLEGLSSGGGVGTLLLAYRLTLHEDATICAEREECRQAETPGLSARQELCVDSRYYKRVVKVNNTLRRKIAR
ncbi:hypothetical protein GCM10023156_39870 [Novipirellula rosea]|uniref:Uncharacterized protein n=1 Tax=Novipirellula rosea TaxID=1031540 RepID=A0ABP8N5G1_9BACT